MDILILRPKTPLTVLTHSLQARNINQNHNVFTENKDTDRFQVHALLFVYPFRNVDHQSPTAKTE